MDKFSYLEALLPQTPGGKPTECKFDYCHAYSIRKTSLFNLINEKGYPLKFGTKILPSAIQLIQLFAINNIDGQLWYLLKIIIAKQTLNRKFKKLFWFFKINTNQTFLSLYLLMASKFLSKLYSKVYFRDYWQKHRLSNWWQFDDLRWL